MLARLSPRQRAVLGFPALGSRYWDDETVSGTEARYQGALDMSAYKKKTPASRL
eukprot:SAG11_NODE_1300_length_5261_cov_8.900232_5_plen_54_part_00